MTTDHPPGPTGAPGDQRARVDALRRRRATQTASPDGNSPGGRPKRPRRRHAAAGGRIVAAGLSAGAALGLVAAMSGLPRAADPATASDQPVVVVRRTSGQATGTAAPAVAPTDAPPVTTSQAS